MGQMKGQQRKERKHVRIYQQQIGTAAWRSLSGSAVKVWVAMGMFETGDNNGEFFCGVRTLAEMTGLSRNTVCKAIAELQDKGFIYCSEPGGFSRKTRHAAKYGFTWLAGPKGEHRAPSHAYAKWSDGNSRSQILTATGAVSDIGVETDPLTGADIEPVETEKPLVSANSCLSEIEPQTVSQGLGSDQAETEQRKQANPDRAAFLGSLRERLCDALVGAQPGTQTQLADAAGIPGCTLSKFKNGGGLPDNHASALARALLKLAA